MNDRRIILAAATGNARTRAGLFVGLLLFFLFLGLVDQRHELTLLGQDLDQVHEERYVVVPPANVLVLKRSVSGSWSHRRRTRESEGDRTDGKCGEKREREQNTIPSRPCTSPPRPRASHGPARADRWSPAAVSAARLRSVPPERAFLPAGPT